MQYEYYESAFIVHIYGMRTLFDPERNEFVY